jgi:hypothetical protein
MTARGPGASESGAGASPPRNGLYGMLDGMPVRLHRSRGDAYLIAGTTDRWVPAERLQPIQRIRTVGRAFGCPVQVLEFRGDEVEVQLFEYQPWIEEYLGSYDRSDGTALVTIPTSAVADVHEDIREYPHASA